MGTFQHFFHECKWHWHIGDVFLNILVSYLHFSDLVWISYEVFKLMLKRSKGKSIMGAKWLGQNQWLLGIRGKTDEWDTTRGINLIIPFFFFSPLFLSSSPLFFLLFFLRSSPLAIPFFFSSIGRGSGTRVEGRGSLRGQGSRVSGSLRVRGVKNRRGVERGFLVSKYWRNPCLHH